MDGRRPRPSPYCEDLHPRLKELKQKLKSFQNKHTTEYLSKITKSSRLPRNMDNIQQILSSDSSCLAVQRCLQNAADIINSRGVLAKYTSPQLNMMTEDLAKMFNHADSSTSVMADNKMNHININSSANTSNTVSRGNISGPAISASEVNHVNIDPSANKSNTVSLSNISWPAIPASEVIHVNIDPSANKSNTVSRGNISYPAKAVNKMNHVDNGLSAYYNNKVNSGKTESSEIVTNKLNNMQL